ncbi:hypothetical protein D910_07156 [Dendroctonus ponderosae]|uniref:Protein JTB n=1 Tax=Dendroctonus ponderosae TaxID=77166 RepID=U4UIP9_DENPD|nr:hypothetical protein D910_07156 [Dendroctonus ponderosae]
MIELCPKKPMLLGIIFLGALTLLVLVLESYWTENNRTAARKNRFIVEQNSSCFEKEPYVVLKECEPCSAFELRSKSLGVCIHTQYIEILRCANGKTVTRSCDKAAFYDEQTFWIFEGLMLVLSLISTLCVKARKRVLNGQYLVDIKTFLVLTIYKLSEACDLRLKVKNISHINGSVLACNFEDLDFDLVHEAPELAQLCTWPPVRIHNIYKIARNNLNDQSLISTKSRADINVLHDYAEGPYFTLADFILYPCFQVFFKYCQYLAVEPQIPLINAWFDKVQQHNFPGVSFQLSNLETKQSCKKKVIVPEIPNVSLYTADPTRALSGNHTNQNKIEAALSLIDTYKADIANNVLPFGFYKSFDWYSIPLGANPQGGALPAKRAARKCEQLENLVKATLEAVGDKTCRIVDFCSGSGHLGILIALALPKCKVILVENKEMSLARAKATIAKLHINNVIIVQSNLDYFTGTFDLGLALHACGVATDLVLEILP